MNYAEHNIQANLILPGIFPHDDPELIEFWRGGKFIPVGRVGQDAELGPACVFLASDLSNYMNGQMLAMEGGGLAERASTVRICSGRPTRRGQPMSLSAFSLVGKNALVLGAGSAIGRAAACALAEAGADVAVGSTFATPREREAVLTCRDAIQSQGRKSLARTIDAANEADVQALVKQTVSELGALDILVNAHDLPFAKPLPDISPQGMGPGAGGQFDRRVFCLPGSSRAHAGSTQRTDY